MSQPNLDEILNAIRAEAARRGGSTRIGPEHAADQASGVRFSRPALLGDPRHVRDYLALSSERLLDNAYRRLLKRPPDAAGAANFRYAMRTGRATKTEVLGQIRYSPEGRAQKVAVPGLAPALALATLYRVPVLGGLIALVVSAARLPHYLRDRSHVERVAQETAAEFES